MDDDPPILPRIARGDSTAVEDCIARHGRLVWSLARKLTLDRSEAEDAVQEIFVELWRQAGRFDPALASETTFVAMIARRRLIDRRRRAAARPQVQPLPVDHALAAPDSLEQIDLVDEASLARRALDELGPDQRLVLSLAIDSGLTYEQIARSLDRPLGTVKSLARRALIRIRERLQVAASPAGEPRS